MALDHDLVTTGSIYPIRDHIIVVNIETEGERKKNGLIILNDKGNERGIRPRWAQVAKVGPDQKEVKPGQWILISHGRWTRGVKLDDGKVYRKVDNNDIFGVSDSKPEDIE